MSDEPIKVQLGHSFNGGAVQVTIRRASVIRRCGCGDPAHTIAPGDYYGVIGPATRHISHVAQNWAVILTDHRGAELARIGCD